MLKPQDFGLAMIVFSCPDVLETPALAGGVC